MTSDKGRHMDRLSGFIFLCNGKTKPECYRYRVFGLPEAKKDVVGKIEPGMELFLFDFELKLLYGVYEATSVGKLNLEPAAFGGKFPAQVSFRICKDCFPLPEGAFKQVIKDNYHNGKFNQELNNQQVRNLLLMFHPLTMPISVPVPPSSPSAARPLTLPPPVIDNLCQPQATLLLREDPYAAGMQVHHNFPILKPQPAPQRVAGQQYSYYGSSTYAHLSKNLQTLPAPTMPCLEDPHASRMQHVHIQGELDTQRIEQSTLPSEPVSDGVMVGTGHVYCATDPHTLQGPTASYLSADTRQAYMQSNPYYRHGSGQEDFHSNQHLASDSGDYPFSLRRKQEIVVQSENAVQNSSLYWPAENNMQNHGLYLPTTTNSV